MTAVTDSPGQSRLKFVVGGFLILAGSGTLFAWAATRPGAFSFFIGPSELLRDQAALEGRPVRVAASIVPGSVHRTGRTMQFVITEGTVTVPVTYSGAVPYTFNKTWEAKGWEVVVEGRLLPGPRLQATNVFVRHPPEMVVRSPSP